VVTVPSRRLIRIAILTALTSFRAWKMSLAHKEAIPSSADKSPQRLPGRRPDRDKQPTATINPLRQLALHGNTVWFPDSWDNSVHL